MPDDQVPERVSVFISYAHEDEEHRQALSGYLKTARPKLDIWHDREIPPGSQWGSEINEKLDSADIMLMLVTMPFLTSDYVETVEIPKALARQQSSELAVIPILLEETPWKGHGLDQTQALPSDERWMLGHAWRDNLAGAWTAVVKGVEGVAATIRVERRVKGEKLEEYRALVGEKLHDHVIDPGERDTLDWKRDKLGLTHEEAAEIERAYRATQQELLDAIAGYEKTLGTYLKQGIYPFNEEQRAQLKSRQKDLALNDEYIDGLEETAVAEWNDETSRVEREASERADADRLAQLEADGLAKDEADRVAKEQAEQEAKDEAERLAKEQAEREAKEKAVREAKEHAEEWGCAVADALEIYDDEVFVKVQPNVSQDDVVAATKACSIPDHEVVIGVIGAGDYIWAFGLQGVYISTDLNSSLEPVSVTYASLPGQEIATMEGGAIVGEMEVRSPVPYGDVWLQLQSLVEVPAHKDQLSAIKVHSSLAKSDMDAVRTDVIDHVVAGAPARKESREGWATALAEYLDKNGFAELHVFPNISEKRLRFATQRYGGRPNVEIVAIIDTTVFGSAKEGLMFGLDGIRFKSAGGSARCVPYTAITSGDFKVDGSDVLIGDAPFAAITKPIAASTAKVLKGVRRLHGATFGEPEVAKKRAAKKTPTKKATAKKAAAKKPAAK